MSAPTADQCIRGHEYTEANTYWRPGRTRPRRQCRECRRIRGREWDARQRAREQEAEGSGTVLAVSGKQVPVGNWVSRGACRNGKLDDFFAREGESPLPVPERVTRAATEHCAKCPVRGHCDAEATERRDIGLWGGVWRHATNAGKYQLTDPLSGGEPS